MNDERFIAIILLSLKQFSDVEVAALANGIRLSGKVENTNVAFQKAVDYGLIKESGHCGFDTDMMERALLIESSMRLQKQALEKEGEHAQTGSEPE